MSQPTFDLFSPSGTSPCKDTSKGRSQTPRRKLCLDDSFQSPSLGSENGHQDVSQSTADSAYSSSLSSESFESPVVFTEKKSDVVTRVSSQHRSKHPNRSFSLALPDKENVHPGFLNELRGRSNSTSFSPLLKQISSPLEQMTLVSPAGSCSSTGSNSDWLNEVFEKTPPRRGSLKRKSVVLDSEEKESKRPPLSPSPDKKPSLKGTKLFRSHSIAVPVPPCENAMLPDSPGDDGVEKIGDHSKPYLLPIVKGSVPDLKCVSPDTVASVIRGEYDDVLDQFDIIDCRYPYEYEGGHIQNACNIWEKDKLLQKYFTNPTHPNEDGKRHIVILHCEFSSKRGPDMSRFMRKIDREKNGMDFPLLFYPELYLLDGGYKSFFQHHSSLCEPRDYTTMHNKDFKEELRLFSKRSKSWAGTSKSSSLRHRNSSCF